MIENDYQEIKYNQPKKWIQYLIISSCSVIGLGLILSFALRIDEVISSRGKIENTGSIKLVKSNMDGYIINFNLSEGDAVQKNAKLIEIDDREYNFNNEILEAQLKEFMISRNLNLSLLEKYEFLNREGVVSEIETLKIKEKLSQIESKIKQISSKIDENKYKKNQTIIRSPVKGRIFESKKINQGYFVQNGELLLKIIPDTLLEAKVYVPNSKRGMIKTNQRVDVRIDAYPFTSFGKVNGRVKYIAENSSQLSDNNPELFYETIISLENQFIEKNNKKYFLKSGESISANIIIKNRPVIFIISDIFKTSWDKIKTINSGD